MPTSKVRMHTDRHTGRESNFIAQSNARARVPTTAGRRNGEQTVCSAHASARGRRGGAGAQPPTATNQEEGRAGTTSARSAERGPAQTTQRAHRNMLPHEGAQRAAARAGAQTAVCTPPQAQGDTLPPTRGRPPRREGREQSHPTQTRMLRRHVMRTPWRSQTAVAADEPAVSPPEPGTTAGGVSAARIAAASSSGEAG